MTENNWTLNEAIEHLDARGTFGCGGCDDAWLYLKEHMIATEARCMALAAIANDPCYVRKIAPEVATLSARQREVAEMIAIGMSDEDIAHKLDLAYGTVKQHCSEIRSKLRVNSRVKIACVMHGIPCEQVS